MALVYDCMTFARCNLRRKPIRAGGRSENACVHSPIVQAFSCVLEGDKRHRVTDVTYGWGWLSRVAV